MIIQIKTEGCNLYAEQPKIADGTAGMVRVRFCTDPLWADLALTAIFRTRRGDILMPLTNGECILPSEASEKCGEVFVGLFGSDGKRTLTSVFCRLRISPGVPTDGKETVGYTPGLYEQFSAKFARFENMTATAEAGETAGVEVEHTDRAVNLHFTLPRGEQGAQGDAGYTLTEEDKDEIVDRVLTVFPIAEEATFGNV